jgi:hypothetical protein
VTLVLALGQNRRARIGHGAKGVARRSLAGLRWRGSTARGAGAPTSFSFGELLTTGACDGERRGRGVLGVAGNGQREADIRFYRGERKRASGERERSAAAINGVGRFSHGVNGGRKWGEEEEGGPRALYVHHFAAKASRQGGEAGRLPGGSYLEQRYPERRASKVWYPQPCNWNLSIIIGFWLENCLRGHF